jgi:enterochelin esterase-like enzyme
VEPLLLVQVVELQRWAEFGVRAAQAQFAARQLVPLAESRWAEQQLGGMETLPRVLRGYRLRAVIMLQLR